MHLEYIPVGQIVNAHGIRGEVKLNPKGFDPEFLAEFPVLYIDGRAMPVKHSRVHKNVLLVTLPGVEDMDAALALKGKQVSVRRADAPVPEDYYFDAELEGLTVVDFKTDRVRTPEEIAERAQHYRPQLEAYSRALERVLEKKVVRRALYFLVPGETVEV